MREHNDTIRKKKNNYYYERNTKNERRKIMFKIKLLIILLTLGGGANNSTTTTYEDEMRSKANEIKYALEVVTSQEEEVEEDNVMYLEDSGVRVEFGEVEAHYGILLILFFFFRQNGFAVYTVPIMRGK